MVRLIANVLRKFVPEQYIGVATIAAIIIGSPLAVVLLITLAIIYLILWFKLFTNLGLVPPLAAMACAIVIATPIGLSVYIGIYHSDNGVYPWENANTKNRYGR